MGCNHKKENERFHLWCNSCAEKVAGPKPTPKWKHGDYAEYKRWDEEGGPHKVLDSEIHLVGIATEKPGWEEYLIFRDGEGSASLFVKMKLVKA